jgi:hypothetical protein
VSLDKAESSSPILKAAHAGASTRKSQHLQQTAPNVADADSDSEGGTSGLFCFKIPDSLPTFEYSPSRRESPLCFAKQPFYSEKCTLV